MAALAPPISNPPAAAPQGGDASTVPSSPNGTDNQHTVTPNPKSSVDSSSPVDSASPQATSSPANATAAATAAPSTTMPDTKGTAPKAEAAPAQTSTAPTASSSKSPAPAPASKPPATSSSTPKSSPPTSKQPPSTSGQKKKRKRKGLAGLLATFGCLSADDFEDEPKAAPAAAAGPSKSSTAATAAGAGVSKPKVDASSTGAGAGAGAKPVANGATDGNKQDVGTGQKADGKATAPVGETGDKQVIVPPAEPHTLPEDETAGLTSSAVQAPGSGSSLLGTPSRQVSHRESNTDLANTAEHTTTSGGYSDISNTDVVDDTTGTGTGERDDAGEEYLDYDDEEDRLIEQGGMGIPTDEHGTPCPLLPALAPKHRGRKCLVLDLDETLLHSSFKQLPAADYIVPVEIESQVHNVYVIKRPGVDTFLTEMAKYYEIVVFTASLSKYADPVLDMLDPAGVVAHRLFRESCYNHKGNYVKDLSQLGRDIHTSIIIDNSPASYIFHPNNAVPVSTWFSDPHDSELTDLVPFLADLSTVDDVRGVLDGRI
ncbi:hypothetical protein IAR50_003766 [Cryptococcus sp. DSM 104548]